MLWRQGFPASVDATVTESLRKDEFTDALAVGYLHVGPFETVTNAYGMIAAF